jgi:hypothetical protein
MKCRPGELFNEVQACLLGKGERRFFEGPGQILASGLMGMKIFTPSLYELPQAPPHTPERYAVTDS